ncbi:hypothetical protein AJ79_10064 [Helicocarpus griseus UAMH5409]|uniref:Uncharacterized protein n=1 Tax=Helicocarpus griseus UAMH5409 TaxID=1447875 RepID=A0A2B7WFF8_9EURO|nr:hypothetical protein AJ79_10064 [Helicocarpus griseus UAMH5409]
MELNNIEWPNLARWNQELDVPGDLAGNWNNLDVADSATSHSVNQNDVEFPLSLPSVGSSEMTTTETHCQTTQLSGSCQCSEKLLQLQEEIKRLWKDKIEKLCIYIQESLQPWTESITERIDDLTNKCNPPEDMDITYHPMADVKQSQVFGFSRTGGTDEHSPMGEGV